MFILGIDDLDHGLGQDWTENKTKYLIIMGQKVVKTPSLKNAASSYVN